MSNFPLEPSYQDFCIHELFESQVEQVSSEGASLNPDVVAIIFEDQQLTYRELNCRANQLAHYLQSLGVEPEVLVGIYVERSLEMVVGLLGILKAGGAYVPLDPMYPQERLALMLADAKVPVLLTQQHLVEKLPEHQALLVCLDADWETIAQHSNNNPTVRVTASNLAYIIYTSGSTGKPKGAMNTHGAICNRLLWMQDAYQLTNTDRVLQKTPFSFDVSVWEFFWTLLSGACLVMARPEGHRDSAYLIEAIAKHKITTLHFVPSMLQVFLEEQGIQTCHSLRQVFCSGEALPPELQKRFFAHVLAKLHNLYGPTEAAIDVTFWQCQQHSLQQIVPIGRPIANTQIYILDSDQKPVPVGEPGELHIGGVGLARGYLHAPELTAEKFIPNPFSNEMGARLYKTGDLARYLPDGNIEFLGRIDYQVKIRGFRIELGEIEAVLWQHPAVENAVVIAREDIPGHKRLVAYVVSKLQRFLVGNLRSFLKQKLPDYMVPSSFVFLNALPLTPNGKVDRKALPIPDNIRPELEEDFVAPRTPVEEVLAEIWAVVLGLKRIGIYDNFLELGGHSLLATQIISRVRDTYQVELPVRELFDRPTVAGLAESIQTMLLENQNLPVSSIQPTSRDFTRANSDAARNLPLSFAQERLWLIDQLVPENPFYNVTEALRLTGSLNVAALEQSLNEIIRRHETLRTIFATVDGRPVQVIHDPPHFKLSVVNLQEIPKIEREAYAQKLATEEGQQIFDLSQGPLLRVTLLQLDDLEYLLLLNLHHILCDGWSLGVLFKELTALYKAFSTGKPSLRDATRTPLPELAIQYADFAIWQRQWLQQKVLEKQLAYWGQQLADLPILQLPTDRPRPLVPTYRGALEPLALPPTLTAALKVLSQQEGVTLFMTLLAAFQTLLCRYTNSEDIPVGSAIANRHQPNVEGLIGFFVNTVVLRTSVSGSLSFKELLVRVREVALAAYTHQDLPFEKLVAELQPERNLSRQPLFQVVFALQNVAPSEDLKLSGLKTTSLTIDNKTAKFDLFLQLSETSNGLTGWFEYSTDLFDAATISRMAGHFQTLLEGIVADPEQCLLDLPLLTERERYQLLVEWNDTQVNYPQDALCIHQLFEAQVAENSDAVAVVFEDVEKLDATSLHLTYGELNCRANQLAHYLRTLGVEPEVLVGICVERSLEMIIGILGILKAGGAYVPLDPAYPKERLAFMLEDAHVSLLLTQEHLVKSLPQHQARVILLDKDWEANAYGTATPIARESTGNPISMATPDNLTYVIYTSGSTGSPKGVLLEHRGLCNLALVQQTLFDVQPSSRVLQFASFSFDASVSEIFMTLVAGATLLLSTRDSLMPGHTLIHLLREQAVTTVTLPPSVLAILPTENLPALRTIIVAGEACSPDLVVQWASGRRFFNAYGPTEATVCATVADCTSCNKKPPIGHPIANMRCFLLDAQLQPVPIGVSGELYISGAGLARGYLNRSDLTAERFIANPFSDEPGERLYKTGDLARYLPDGNIEFMGRIDHQVKIRGFRIELEEIEAALDQHPAVREAAVTAREDASGNKGLVGYIVPNPVDESTKSEQVELWPSIAEYFVYDELLYHAITNDERRNNSYKVAINQSVKDKVVVDIGTGRDAILARFCVEAGAKKVYAIEILDESYQRAKACLKALELENKIILIHGDSTQVQLPEKVDVCVSEIVGSIGGAEGAAYILNDARRFLKPNGIMIPKRSTTKIAAVFLPEELLNNPCFTELSGYYTNKIFAQVGYKFDLRLCIKNFPKSNIISDIEVFEDLDFTHSLESEYNHEVSFNIIKDANIDGFLVWLNLDTIEGESIDILEKQYCWLPVYLPVFYPEIQVLEGDIIKASISGIFCDNKLNLDYRIRGSLIRISGEVIDFEYTSFHFKNLFKQTTFYQLLFSEDIVKITPQAKLAQNLIPEMRRFLQEKLPDYMVPSAFVFLDTLPITPNGKLDRSALPAPNSTRTQLEEDFVADRTLVEKQIVSLWNKVLGIEKIGINENFFELGGNSLLAAQLIAYIRETFSVELPMRCLFEKPTVEGLAHSIQTLHQDGISAITSVIDLSAEAVLPPEIFPQGTPIDDLNEPRHIFLTGATGFVGAFLLHELLEQTQAKIYCLVRSPNENEGAKRLQRTLEKYLLWNPNQSSRIIPTIGDLEQPRLGLSAEQFERLAFQIDSIYHNGAQVNFAKPYSTIKAANVDGTQEVLRLACMGKVKPVHYISTCGMYGPISYFTGINIIKEEDDIDIAQDYLCMDIGYAQSKWVAEKIVHIAKARKLPISIYRLGLVMGDTRTGVGNTADYVSRMIKGCIQLGTYPNLVAQKQEFVSVDFVTKAIVNLSNQKKSLGKAFHLVPLPSQNIDLIKFFELISSFGYELKKVPYTQWKNELIKQTQKSQDNALYPLVPMLAERVYQDSLTIIELYQNTPEFDCKNTLDGLAGTSIVCPPMDDKLLETYFSYFIRSGFLAPPK